jgi:hypothetical protein
MLTRPTFLSVLSSLTRLGSLFKSGPKITVRTSKKAKNCVADDHEKRFEAARKILHSRSTERRRTARVPLAVPLTVQGQTEMNEKFCVKTTTLSVSGYGGMIILHIPVVVGQTLVLINEYEQREYECSIVSVRRAGDKKQYVGFEFVDPACNFWHMTFTAPGARPLRRVTPIRISA